MPCGRYLPEQFSSQVEYEDHRTKMMRLILGEDWQDKSLSQLVEEHPELSRLSLHQLLHQAGHQQRHQGLAELIQSSGAADKPQAVRHAIESGERQTAADWIKQFKVEPEPSKRKD